MTGVLFFNRAQLTVQQWGLQSASTIDAYHSKRKGPEIQVHTQSLEHSMGTSKVHDQTMHSTAAKSRAYTTSANQRLG